jgi:hypothetical protein
VSHALLQRPLPVFVVAPHFVRVPLWHCFCLSVCGRKGKQTEKEKGRLLFLSLVASFSFPLACSFSRLLLLPLFHSRPHHPWCVHETSFTGKPAPVFVHIHHIIPPQFPSLIWLNSGVAELSRVKFGPRLTFTTHHLLVRRLKRT